MQPHLCSEDWGVRLKKNKFGNQGVEGQCDEMWNINCRTGVFRTMGEWSLVAPQVLVWGFLVVWVHCKFAVVFVFQVGVAFVFWFPSQFGLPSSPCACILSFLAFGFQFGVALVFGFVFGFWFSSCLGSICFQFRIVLVFGCLFRVVLVF